MFENRTTVQRAFDVLAAQVNVAYDRAEDNIDFRQRIVDLTGLDDAAVNRAIALLAVTGETEFSPTAFLTTLLNLAD